MNNCHSQFVDETDGDAEREIMDEFQRLVDGHAIRLHLDGTVETTLQTPTESIGFNRIWVF